MKMTAVVVSIVALTIFAGCSGTSAGRDPRTVQTGSRALSRIAGSHAREAPTGAVGDAVIALRRVHFGLDSSTLTPAGRSALVEVAAHLGQHPDVHIFVDGHCDERGTTEYNMGLGDRRARAVAQYLASLGIEPQRLHTMSFGAEQPIVAGASTTAYARNRRADFRRMRGRARIVVEDGVLHDDRGRPMAGAALSPPPRVAAR